MRAIVLAIFALVLFGTLPSAHATSGAEATAVKAVATLRECLKDVLTDKLEDGSYNPGDTYIGEEYAECWESAEHSKFFEKPEARTSFAKTLMCPVITDFGHAVRIRGHASLEELRKVMYEPENAAALKTFTDAIEPLERCYAYEILAHKIGSLTGDVIPCSSERDITISKLSKIGQVAAIEEDERTFYFNSLIERVFENQLCISKAKETAIPPAPAPAGTAQ